MKSAEEKSISLQNNLIRVFAPQSEIQYSALEKLLKLNLLYELNSDEIGILPQIVAQARILGVKSSQVELLEKMFEPFVKQTLLLQNGLPEPVRLCNDLHIEPVLLKGAALWKKFPSYCSGRRLTDLDILIPYERRLEVFEHFEKKGWKLSRKFRKQDTDWGAGFPFYSRKLGITVDLHWALIPQDLAPETAILFFEASHLISEGNLKYRIPEVELLFYHAMLHGNRYGDTGSRMQWKLDCALILQHFPHLDWNIMVTMGARAEAFLPILDSLLLFRKLGLEIPANVLDRLKAHQPCSRELFQYQITQLPNPRLRTLKLTQLIAYYIKLYRLWTFRFKLCRRKIGPISFLKYITNSETVIDLIEVFFKFLKTRKQI